MLARVYKRNLHHNLIARAADPSSVSIPSQADSTSSSVADPKTSEVLTSLSPAPVTSSKVANTPTPTPSSTSSSSASSAAPSSTAPTSTSSSTSASSSTPTSSSASSAHASSASNPLIVPSATSPNSYPLTTQVVTGINFTPASSATPSATSSTSTSGGVNTGVIIGGVAGTLAGIVAVGLLLMWCMRRQRNHDADDFDAQAFRRQSAILVDDPVDSPHSRNPRPPTMIERHNASPALAAQGGFGGQNFYGNYGGYGQQQPYPSEMPSSAPPQTFAASPMGYAGYDGPRQQMARQPSNVGFADDSRYPVVRQPSNANYLTRQPSSAAGYTPPTAPPTSLDPNARYIDLNRSSVSPYQATQYADISRQLGTTNPDNQVPQRSNGLPDGLLPSPFDDPSEANAVLDTTTHGHPSDVGVPAVQPHGNTPAPHERPTTVYEEGDAYGGI